MTSDRMWWEYWAEQCPKCLGSGIERHHFHGVWPNGEACVEPVKCEACDGFGGRDAKKVAEKATDSVAPIPEREPPVGGSILRAKGMETPTAE